jgi:DNA sulfur modification protein DndB
MKVKFPAMEATIGQRTYYACVMKLAVIPKMFTFRDWIEFTPEDREQRVLNKDRIPDIARYILDNEDGYLFSSITASYKCNARFEPVNSEGHGFLEMDFQDANFVINDGQHRCAAIAHAIRANPAIGEEAISVLLFPYESKERVQQMFSDLNRYVQKTPRPLNILFDQRDAHARITLEVCESVPVFKDLVDKENVSLPARSEKAFTLASLYDATQELLAQRKNGESDGYHELVAAAVDYWITISKLMPDWWKIKNREIRPIELRQENISTHSVVLRALGGIGAEVMRLYGADWKNHLTGIASISWSKKNRDWENVCMVANSVVANRQARLATKAYLKRKLGLPVSDSEQKSISVLTEKEEQGNNGAETEGPLTTKEWDALLIEVLRALGGKCRKPEAEAEAYRRMKPVFDQHYSHAVGEGIPAWKKQFQFARQRACNKGLVEHPEKAGEGIWRLTSLPGEDANPSRKRQTVRPIEVRIENFASGVARSNEIPVVVANWILARGVSLRRIQNFMHQTDSGFPIHAQTKRLENGWFIEIGDSQDTLLQKGRRLLDAHGFREVRLVIALEDGSTKTA